MKRRAAGLVPLAISMLLGVAWCAASSFVPAQAFGAGAHFGGGHFGGGHFGGGGHFAGGGRVAGVARFGAAIPRFSGTRIAPGAFGRGFAAAVPRTPGFRSPMAGERFSGPRAGAAAPGRWGPSGRDWDRDRWPGVRWPGGYWRDVYWPPVIVGVGFAWFVPIIPAWCPVYWWGGVPYYYYNDAYYTWDPDQNGYIATSPPPVTDGAEGSVTEAGDGGPLYAYPKNGQSARQQSQDRQACEQWARSQSARGSGEMSDYRRALAACLTGRGYSVD